MNFSKQDKLDYISYLRNQLNNEERKPESLFTNYNIFNISKDLINMQKTINNK